MATVNAKLRIQGNDLTSRPVSNQARPILLSKTVQALRIVGQIFGEPFNRPSQVAGKVVTRNGALCRLRVQCLLQTFAHER